MIPTNRPGMFVNGNEGEAEIFIHEGHEGRCWLLVVSGQWSVVSGQWSVVSGEGGNGGEFLIFLGKFGVDCQNVTPLNTHLITP
jgi:hypothetical protein